MIEQDKPGHFRMIDKADITNWLNEKIENSKHTKVFCEKNRNIPLEGYASMLVIAYCDALGYIESLEEYTYDRRP